MDNLQYVGARYVPKFYNNKDGTCNWNENTAYEALTIVTYNNSSYTSKIPVPPYIGNPAENKQYWVNTGNFNAQLEEFQVDLNNIKHDVNKHNKVFSFESQRQFRILNTNVGQCFCWNGVEFVIFGANGVYEKYNITGQLTASGKIDGLNQIHCNDCAYYNNKIYVCDGGSLINGTIYIVDNIEMEITGTIDSNIDNVIGVSIYDGTLYAYGYDDGVLGIYKYVNKSLYKICNIILPESYLTYQIVLQGFCVYENVAYIVTNYNNNILAYNVNSGELLYIYNCGDGDGYFPFSEIESLCVCGDNIYMIDGCASMVTSNATAGILQVFKTNLLNTAIRCSGFKGQLQIVDYTVYVNGNSNSTNPDGTSTRPFKSMLECCLWLSYTNNDHNNKIQQIEVNNVTNDYIVLHDSSVYIVTNNCTFNNIRLRNCNIAITNSYANDINVTGGVVKLNGVTTRNLYTSGANIDLSGCEIIKIDGYLSNINPNTSLIRNITDNTYRCNFSEGRSISQLTLNKNIEVEEDIDIVGLYLLKNYTLEKTVNIIVGSDPDYVYTNIVFRFNAERIHEFITGQEVTSYASAIVISGENCCVLEFTLKLLNNKLNIKYTNKHVISGSEIETLYLYGFGVKYI